MGRKIQARVKSLEKLSVIWVILITFCVGLAVVLPHHLYPPWLNQDLVLLLYIFLEFLPLLFYVFTVTQPTLSPYLLLPWILVNTCLVLFSSILTLSLSIPNPTKRNVILCLAVSVLIIFPIITTIIVSLPTLIFIRRRIPNYRRKIKNSEVYRKVTGAKTAAEIEEEIKARRREQVKNTIVTDKSYEQFIYVNRAAAKWKKKVEMKRVNQETSEKKMFAEGNVTVNVGYGLDTVEEESVNNKNIIKDCSKRQTNGVSNHDHYNRIENGKMMTDV